MSRNLTTAATLSSDPTIRVVRKSIVQHLLPTMLPFTSQSEPGKKRTPCAHNKFVCETSLSHQCLHSYSLWNSVSTPSQLTHVSVLDHPKLQTFLRVGCFDDPRSQHGSVFPRPTLPCISYLHKITLKFVRTMFQSPNSSTPASSLTSKAASSPHQACSLCNECARHRPPRTHTPAVPLCANVTLIYNDRTSKASNLAATLSIEDIAPPSLADVRVPCALPKRLVKRRQRHVELTLHLATLQEILSKAAGSAHYA